MVPRHRLALVLALLLFHCHAAYAQTRYTLTPVRSFYAPTGMNDLGQIAGISIPEAPEVRSQGAVWTPGASPPLTLLGTPPDVAQGINNAGQVAGTHRFSPTVDRAVVFSDGSFRDLGTLGGRRSTGYAINESGQVAGFAAVASGQQHAFLYSGGTMRDLGALVPGGWSYGYGMNDKGQVLGSATVAPRHDAPAHPFLYSDGTMTDLSRFAAEEGSANAINILGQIAGVSRIGNDDYRGFLYDHGVTTYLGLPGALSSAALSINDKGDIVGYSSLSTTEGHGFIHTDGNTIDLNTLLDTEEGWTVNSALLINDAGQIAGMACRPHPSGGNGLDCATVLMTPVPEPAGWALWTCAGLFGLAMAKKKSRQRLLRLSSSR